MDYQILTISHIEENAERLYLKIEHDHLILKNSWIFVYL